MNAALWTDEMVTLQHIGAAPQFGPITPQQSLLRVAADPWQAPLYFVAVYGWGHIAGWSPLALRLFSLYSGLLALALLFRLVRRNFTAEIAVFAVFTTGVSAFFVHYLYDMRGYTFVTLLVLLLIAAYEQTQRSG
ncbi:MAG: glycosyltransferase family 39 protein, partial [Anaerolineae bacterium]|nr:glycosyltransferase family 39 protein [Anaerolineae bacterium]